MKLLALVILTVTALAVVSAKQKYSVRGKLMCGDAPASNIQVKLVDKDIGLDDTLGNVKTGSDGSFQVEGKASGGLTGIDPFLKIYHKCGGGSFLRCSRRWRMKMPTKYIVNENQPSKWFDLGVMNLIVKLEHSEDHLHFSFDFWNIHLKKMKGVLAIAILAAMSANWLVMAGEQRVIVKGRLTCGDKPASGVKVKLYDIDTGFDDLMGEKATGGDGSFQIDGKTSELTTIDPMLKIYHNCHDSKPCDRRIRLDIPTEYIGKDGKTPKTLDIGVWNLQTVYKEEDRDCIH